ncbi:DEAD/DEAH box helicase family protein [Clostridium sp. 'deep sea']|uniref:DEAD/DEAH box helicase n=1 Tax=Clostridium sp. 'deep sea' TaxID=2779445 RepID=UPI0018967AC6|nr:DEAD/DEAH box helicase family protein [Clostridium sp. 'deep sea']QOR36879.1 DEAD/DEAH box helicase family protein [Clostridium sp. 'deep sea']
MSYFISTEVKINDNPYLRKPQKYGYIRLNNHFVSEKKDKHALIVLPTGVGKTGLMAIAPYNISEKKVLIIAPQTTIRDGLEKSLDPSNPHNFYLKYKVIENPNDLPSLIVYDSKTTFEELCIADIVIINIQKLQQRLDNSLINRLPRDFFDMIIIDEAHHSPAKTWVETCNYFLDAKVLKVTATPFRSDDSEIAGELIYRYTLGQAMEEGYVKQLKDITYVPDKLYLTIEEEGRQYTVDEIYRLDLKDSEWISRSVAYSNDCSRSVVEASISMLQEKRDKSDVPHKIIAVACSMKHAEEVCEIYREYNLRAKVIHSDLNKNVKNEILSDLENHRIDVIVNVHMLSEGFDHKYLSIGAIFRPFRSLLPYSQFVGRLLRVIPDDEISDKDDNVACIISHNNLYLHKLWELYQKEVQEAEIIKHLKEIDDLITNIDNEGNSINQGNVIDFGEAKETGYGTLTIRDYFNDDIQENVKQRNQLYEEEIKRIMEENKTDQETAIKIYNILNKKDKKILRPDLLRKFNHSTLDDTIRYNYVPSIISSLNLNLKGRDIQGCKLFIKNFSWIGRDPKFDNSAMLAIYFNQHLKQYINRSRDKWVISDFERAWNYLDDLKEFILLTLKHYKK